jgi:diacylglycerol kinase
VVMPEQHPSVKRAKDIAAGAVLVCAAFALVVGVLTFWPYVMV